MVKTYLTVILVFYYTTSVSQNSNNLEGFFDPNSHSLIGFKLINEKMFSSLDEALSTSDSVRYLKIGDIYPNEDSSVFIVNEDFLKLRNLKYIRFVNKPNIKFDIDFENFDKLEYIQIRYCNLYEIPASLFNCESLKALDFSENNLESEDLDLLWKLKNLESLIISFNQLKDISGSIFELSNLKTLFIVQNPINVVPKEISNLKNLNWLNLSKCAKLSALPNNIHKLQRITRIDIEGTNICKFPESLFEIENNLILNYSYSKCDFDSSVVEELKQKVPSNWKFYPPYINKDN